MADTNLFLSHIEDATENSDAVLQWFGEDVESYSKEEMSKLLSYGNLYSFLANSPLDDALAKGNALHHVLQFSMREETVEDLYEVFALWADNELSTHLKGRWEEFVAFASVRQ